MIISFLAWPQEFSSGLVLGIVESSNCGTDETPVTLQTKDAAKMSTQKWTASVKGVHKKFKIQCSDVENKDMVLYSEEEDVFSIRGKNVEILGFLHPFPAITVKQTTLRFSNYHPPLTIHK